MTFSSAAIRSDNISTQAIASAWLMFSTVIGGACVMNGIFAQIFTRLQLFYVLLVSVGTVVF